ncbi:hypothetical protein H5410_047830, partial [Solanum commersonii]
VLYRRIVFCIEEFNIGNYNFQQVQGTTSRRYDDEHDSFIFEDIDKGEVLLLYFVNGFELVIANSSFQKWGENLMNFYNVRRKINKRVENDQPMIRQGGLTKTKAQDIREKEMVIKAWGDSGDTYSMWVRTPNCIRQASREIGLVVEWRGSRKVESNNVAYLMLVKSLDEDDEMRNKDMYKKTKKKAKLAVTMAKATIFEHLYEELECIGGFNKSYRLIKVRERRSCDLDQGKYIKNENDKVLVEGAHIR